MENETVDIIEVAAKKGLLTVDNGIKVMAAVGVVATVYYGYKGLCSLAGVIKAKVSGPTIIIAEEVKAA